MEYIITFLVGIISYIFGKQYLLNKKLEARNQNLEMADLIRRDKLKHKELKTKIAGYKLAKGELDEDIAKYNAKYPNSTLRPDSKGSDDETE